MQVLGSGGPIADDDRAGTGYALWVQGRPRVLVDMGSGTFLRFAQAGLDAKDPDVLLLSHLHVDHTADVSALLKSAQFGPRERPLRVVGPTGSERFPTTAAYFDSLIGKQGAYRYLSGYLEDGVPFALDIAEARADGDDPQQVFESEGIQIAALGVAHGPVPALAYRAQAKGRSVVFMGDQRAEKQAFVELARNADLMIAHVAIPDDAGSEARALHATPSRIGQVVREAGVAEVVLSHWMARSLERRSAVVDSIREGYEGRVHVARDLSCFTLD